MGIRGRTPNLARFTVLDPAAREFSPDRDRFAEMCVAIMRAESGHVLPIHAAQPGSPSAERLRLLASGRAEHRNRDTESSFTPGARTA